MPRELSAARTGNTITITSVTRASGLDRLDPSANRYNDISANRYNNEAYFGDNVAQLSPNRRAP
jgi:hypothetical protein